MATNTHCAHCTRNPKAAAAGGAVQPRPTGQHTPWGGVPPGGSTQAPVVIVPAGVYGLRAAGESRIPYTKIARK